MRFILPLLILLFGLSTGIQAQKSLDLFKVPPKTTDGLPAWAVLMYSDNPNVYEVERLRNQHYRENSYEKDIHERNFLHWRQMAGPYLKADGNIDWNRYQKTGKSVKSGGTTWYPIGPMETLSLGSEDNIPVSWQSNVYCFDQCASAPDVLYAGVEAGELFKSLDKGEQWFPVTEQLFVASPTALRVAPSDPDLVYFAANGTLYKSTNGGTSWTEMLEFSGTLYEIEIHPQNPDIVLLAGSPGLFRSTDGGTSWLQETSTICWDVKFHTTDPNVVFHLRHNNALNRADFFRSTDTGATWALQENGWYIPETGNDASDIGAKLGLTPADPDRVYVAMIGQSKNGDNGWIGVYRSDDGGSTWTLPLGQIGGPYNGNSIQNLATINRNGTGFHQGFYNFAMAVSHNDADHLWVGCLALTESTDGGASWERIGSYNAQENARPWVHPDIQDMLVLGDDVWFTSDGGVNYSNDELATHESRKNGIYNSTFWGYNQGWNSDIQVGGRYHNGNTGYYQSYDSGLHLRLGGAESPTGYVNPLLDRKTYFSDVADRYIPATIDGPQIITGSISMYPNESYWTSLSSELEFDPRYAEHLYLGKDGSFWKSVNEGGTFFELHNFGILDILEFEISRENPEVIYAVTRSTVSTIRRSNDGGVSWNPLATFPGGNLNRAEIALDPLDENTLWVIEVNGDKVFRTTDGGSSWESLGGGILSGQSLRDVQVQGGNGGAYVASTTDVFYWDESMQAFTPYGSGLPQLLDTYELRIFFKEGLIRLIDKGKGIWEAPLAGEYAPVAQPITLNNNLYCSRDTVPFDCFSMMPHENAQWEWFFEPEPLYVSANDVRNPRVVFGSDGSYTVGLTVTDGQGNSATKTIENMVNVVSGCDVEEIADKGLVTENDGDFATTTNFDVTTNTFTITAWVRPDGIQNDYSGIVMNNGVAAGLNFRGGNNTLGYHWPGGAWWWDSNQIVEPGKWSYVALVVTPQQIITYLNGVPAVHNTAAQAVAITTMNIGSYQGWSGRNFEGTIDEVRIWNRALSQNEIREWRHLTLPEDAGALDEELLAYYQFNETEGNILDRKGLNHASLGGNAFRAESGAPVGGGVSDRISISGTGNFGFPATTASATIAPGSDSPEGEVVLSRIHVLPSGMPAEIDDAYGYHILNNYGLNTTFDPLSELWLKFDEMSEAESSGTLLRARGENDDFNPWMELCAATDYSEESGLLFGPDCEIGSAAQLLFGITEISVSAEDTAEEEAGVSFFPNPVVQSGMIYMENQRNERLRIQLYDGTGKLLKDVFAQPHERLTIPLHGLPGGAYHYSVQGDQFIRNGTLIVQ